jgi:hypothetical protein
MTLPLTGLPPVNRRTFRRTALMAAAAAVVAVAALVPAGYPRMALFGCAGLALGLFNAWLVQRSVARFSGGQPHRKARFTAAMLGRLAVITAVAITCAILIRPDGLAVFGGLAVFQLLTIISASVPLVREIRRI